MTKSWFKLTRKNIKRLIAYYVVLLIIGIVMTMSALLHEIINIDFKFTISLISIIGGSGTALFGCSVFYLRKLYKSCINNEIDGPITNEDIIRELGIKAYFYLRPIFAVAFSVLIHIALKSSIHVVTVKETTLADGFVYLTMLLSFFAGFASGDLISYFESKSAKIATKAFKQS